LSTSSITPLRSGCITRSASTTITSPARAVIPCSPPGAIPHDSTSAIIAAGARGRSRWPTAELPPREGRLLGRSATATRSGSRRASARTAGARARAARRPAGRDPRSPQLRSGTRLVISESGRSRPVRSCLPATTHRRRSTRSALGACRRLGASAHSELGQDVGDVRPCPCKPCGQPGEVTANGLTERAARRAGWRTHWRTATESPASHALPDGLDNRYPS